MHGGQEAKREVGREALGIGQPQRTMLGDLLSEARS